MEVIPDKTLPDVLLIKPQVFGDSRGYFLESFQSQRYSESNLPQTFVQDNISRSTEGVLRGLHYQLEHTQGKLVFVTRGSVFDVAVDVRKGSKTFGKFACYELNDKNHFQLYVPPGFAHGFCVLSETVDFTYKCTDYYHPQSEKGIIWNDPEINIPWPVSAPSLSDKDKLYCKLSDIPETDLL